MTPNFIIHPHLFIQKKERSNDANDQLHQMSVPTIGTEKLIYKAYKALFIISEFMIVFSVPDFRHEITDNLDCIILE